MLGSNKSFKSYRNRTGSRGRRGSSSGELILKDRSNSSHCCSVISKYSLVVVVVGGCSVDGIVEQKRCDVFRNV